MVCIYGKLAASLPDAATEVAYTAAVFPRSVSFATGWIVTLSYLIVCPYEAVAIGAPTGLFGFIHRPADHQRHELIRRGLRRQQGGDFTPVAKDGDAIPQSEHLG